MSCFDCGTKIALRRVERFMRSGGKRLHIPSPCGFIVVTILGLTAAGELRLCDERGREWQASACVIPLIAFAGVA